MEKQELTVENLLILIQEKDHRIAELEREAARVTELENQVQWLMEQFRLAKHKQFGASSEQTDLNQLYLVQRSGTDRCSVRAGTGDYGDQGALQKENPA